MGMTTYLWVYVDQVVLRMRAWPLIILMKHDSLQLFTYNLGHHTNMLVLRSASTTQNAISGHIIKIPMNAYYLEILLAEFKTLNSYLAIGSVEEKYSMKETSRLMGVLR